MSGKYNMTLGTVACAYAGVDEADWDFDPDNDRGIDNVITTAREHIFDFPWEVFDDAYKTVLEEKIIRHFWYRELCCKSVGQWKMFVRQTLDEVMPYFNQLYKSELIKFNPLHNVDMTVERDMHSGSKSSENSDLSRTESTTNSGNSSTTGEQGGQTHDMNTNSTDRTTSLTPQGTISELRTGKHMSSADTEDITTNNISENQSTQKYARADESHNSATGSEVGNKSREGVTTEQYVQHIFGKGEGGTMSSAMMEFRKTFLNIDKQVMDSLNSCFMIIW